VAVATGAGALVETALGLLAPYAGRGVANGGGAAFAGVVSDYLYQASELLGTGDAEQWAARAAGEYKRLGALWWLRRLPPAVPRQSTGFSPQDKGSCCRKASPETCPPGQSRRWARPSVRTAPPREPEQAERGHHNHRRSARR